MGRKTSGEGRETTGEGKEKRVVYYVYSLQCVR